MEFRLLGPVEVVDGDGRPIALGQRPRTVLALLLLDANEVVSTDRLIDGIWAETAPPASAAGSLQVHVHALRKAIGAERIVTRDPGYAIQVEHDELDVLRFERFAAEGRRALHGGDAAGAAASLAEALALWRGPALADFRYAPFAQTEAQRLEEARTVTLEARIEADLRLGRHAGLVAELEALVAEHPLRERLRGQLMLALYRSGRQADALAAYHEARRVLVDQLGIDPSPELRELEQAVLRQDPALAPIPTPAAAVGDAGAGLIGRELELTAVAALLGREDTRLVTLTGTGGSGKTRLARAVAEQHEDSVFVDLAPVGDPSLVLPTIARALQVDEHEDHPLLDDVAQALDGSGLLVLDNLEHLLGAFPLVGELLGAAPAQSILATSRVPLRLAAEHEYRVPPLPTPPPGADDPATLRSVASVHLYCERARSVLPAFELVDENSDAVARICRALDGLPLAIELAAARVRVLGPEGTAKRLGEALALLTRGSPDIPERQRSLRATIDWSYDLLDADSRHVFQVLGAFAGGCSLDGVESVSRDDVDVPTAVETLLDAGLVTSVATPAGEPCFGMLETIREYALAKLEAAGEVDLVRDRQVAYFLRLVDDGIAVRARDPGRYGRTVTPLDRDNFRAALDHAAATGDDEALLALTAGLTEFLAHERRDRGGAPAAPRRGRAVGRG
jgi:predicted ATPase/DNA-binding SARP family transcriptional activator